MKQADRSLWLIRLSILILDSLAWSNLSEKDVEKKLISECHSTMMWTQIWRSQPRVIHTLERSTWMPCTLEWVNRACRSPMSVQPSIMQGTFMTSLFPSLESWQPFQHQVRFRKENCQTTISGGLSLNKVLIAVHLKRETLTASNLSPSRDIVLWITTFPTTNTSKIAIMTLCKLITNKNTNKFSKRKEN